MADTTVVTEPPMEEVTGLPNTLVDEEPKSLNDAIRIVLRAALEANGVVRGLSEVTRALDRQSVHMCFLAADCEDEDYKKLVAALATQGNIDFVEVESREDLALWVGLARYFPDGTLKKTFKCSCVAIRDFGERTKALDMLLSQLSK